MRLENISKIFGVLAFVSFLLMILVGIMILLGRSSNPGLAAIVLGMSIMFILAAILTTLKRIAHDMEQGKKE
jgi:hypothetical protein